MKPRLLSLGVALLTLAVIGTPASRAAGIPAGSMDLRGTAVMDITLLPKTFLNPFDFAIPVPGVSGFGTIHIEYAAEDTSTNTIAVTSLTGGMYSGSYPNLGSYIFGNVPPLTGTDFTAQISNIVHNPDGSFASGTFTLGGPSFAFTFLDPPLAGITLITDPTTPFGFTSTFTSLSPGTGTVLTNALTDGIVVLYQGTPVAITSNRSITLTSVPEPSSIVMFGVGAVGLLGFAGLRRKGATREAGH